MTVAALVLAVFTVLPADRMAMADRQFDRGHYADAKAEYLAVRGAEGIAEDELLYRLAECDRALGDKASAREFFAELLKKYPLSRHADRARLQKALASEGAARLDELKLLDRDNVAKDVRAAALYHYGSEANDAAALAKCLKLDPKGRYAVYARFRHASLTIDSDDAAVRRTAIAELMEIHYGPDTALGREALYLAANRSYAEKRYGEASSLFKRYMKVYPDDARLEAARSMAAWSAYMTGKYADAITMCGEGATDDTAYLLAAAHYATGDAAKARPLFQAYLERFPHGKYRSAVELPLARMEFDDAEKSDNAAKIIEAARRSAALSKSAVDRLRLAWALEKGGLAEEARAEYARLAIDFPKTEEAAEALFREAMMELRAHKWSSAELLLAEALATGKGLKRKAESLYWRGIAASRLGHDAEAGAFLDEALQLGLSLDESREARLVLADFDFKAGRLKEAKAAYAQLVREGACERMSAAKMRNVGQFLLTCPAGEDATEEAKMCARALAANGGSAEWRQAGYSLLGLAEEAAGEYSGAIESYRKAMAEPIRTEDSARVVLSLGQLLSKTDAHGEADAYLKEAVQLNARDNARRAEAYLWLAKNCEAMTDYRGAVAYATIVVTLFDDRAAAAEAQKILDAHPEEAAE